jgi:thiol-disulfide isomerase/thioredoxin
MNKTNVLAVMIGIVALGALGAWFIQSRVGEKSGLPSLSDLVAPQPPAEEGELPKLGPMPEIAGIAAWLNSPPLTREDLKGKVVLVDFMTYSCINCIRTFPYLNAWYDKYRDDGFVIVGIHTPEFEFEKDEDNVRKALADFGIEFPVGLDNDYATWTNFHNRYWPAKYLFDRDGVLRLKHFGEGEYAETEAAIQQLLGVEEEMTDMPVPDLSGIRSPETYFGYGRAERFASPERVSRDRQATYSFPASLAPNQWALAGEWTVREEFAESSAAGASLEFRFYAGTANVVMASADAVPKPITAAIDGKDLGADPVTESRLYEFRAPSPGDHLLKVTVPAGVRVYAITFGE